MSCRYFAHCLEKRRNQGPRVHFSISDVCCSSEAPLMPQFSARLFLQRVYRYARLIQSYAARDVRLWDRRKGILRPSNPCFLSTRVGTFSLLVTSCRILLYRQARTVRCVYQVRVFGPAQHARSVNKTLLAFLCSPCRSRAGDTSRCLCPPAQKLVVLG